MGEWWRCPDIVVAASEVWPCPPQGTTLSDPDERERLVARFVTFFSYTPEAWSRLLDNPGDRSGPVGMTIADAGGRLLSLDYLFGERDGMAVFETPDSASAAAVALIIASSGAFRSVATHELVSSTELTDVLRKAASARRGYVRPGE
jgi:uncharacterized protein with GYD domain